MSTRIRKRYPAALIARGHSYQARGCEGMNIEQRCHGGERPRNVCGVCSSIRLIRRALMRHMRSAHPGIGYECPICQGERERYLIQADMIEHLTAYHSYGQASLDSLLVSSFETCVQAPIKNPALMLEAAQRMSCLWKSPFRFVYKF